MQMEKYLLPVLNHNFLLTYINNYNSVVFEYKKAKYIVQLVKVSKQLLKFTSLGNQIILVTNAVQD